MFAVVVRFSIKPDEMDNFMPLMKQNAQASLSLEPACNQFDVLTDPSQPNEVLLYEIYKNEEGFKEHLESSHFQSFDKKVASMVADKSVQTYRQVN